VSDRRKSQTKRGRPPRNGTEPGWTFGRILLVIDEFDRLRSSGDKHSAAIADAVVNLKKRCPGFNVSESEVRRILARYRPKGARGLVLTAIRLSPAELEQLEAASDQMCELARDLKLPPGWKLEVPPSKWKAKQVYLIAFAPRPQYPRSNARAR
jgi:hypothetical protein